MTRPGISKSGAVRRGVAAVIILIAAYVLRFRYINSQFPEGTLTVVPYGETYQQGEVRYTILSGEIVTAAEFTRQYNPDIYYNDDMPIMIVWVEIENTADEERKMGVGDMVMTRGTWANGQDYFALWYINGESFDGMLAPGESERIGVSTIVNNDMDIILKTGDEWRLRLSGWPDRVEMVIELEEEEEHERNYQT